MRNVFNIIIVAGALACAALPLTQRALASPDGENSASDTTFHEVALMCPAAAGLGCGSKAKPILLSLEKTPVVAEAWLDRTGQTLAIIWKRSSTAAERAVALANISKAYGVSVEEISGKDREEVARSLQTGTDWHRGADVDRLSEEEAGVIADRLLARVVKSMPTAKDHAETFRPVLTESLRHLLIDAPGQSREQWRDKLLTSARQHLSELETTAFRDAMESGFRAVGEER